MGLNMVRRRFSITVACAGSVVLNAALLMLWCLPRHDHGESTRAVGDDSAGFRMWMELTRREMSIQSRRAIAGQLARSPAGEPWLVLLLSDPWALYTPGEGSRAASLPQATLDELRVFDAAIIAALIEDVPANAGASVLWALTSKLSDTRRGKYSEERGSGLARRRVECESAPLRDLARQSLSRCLHMDCGYDTLKWREAILASQQAKIGARPASEKVSG